MNLFLSARRMPWIVAGAAAIVLAGAHLLEEFGWPPCELCLRQRTPYWIGIALALLAAVAALPRFNLALASMLLMAAVALTFGVGAGLAVQHIGVEEHWWKSACSAGGPAQISDLLKDFGKPIVACDERRPFLFGLTLAAYNLLVSIVLMVAAASVPARMLMRQDKSVTS